MVVCAVRYEPVSTCNSLLTGKITGNFTISRLLEAIPKRKAPVPQPLLGKFPTKINREIILTNREIFGRNREICNAYWRSRLQVRTVFGTHNQYFKAKKSGSRSTAYEFFTAD